ncbi:hypothetical protein PQ689_09920 [Thermoanaerobacterium thermosaccharolyticum]|uniref:hypothetical protein n=1 Tax=Thermoanaerobacterium thermosaccharolyticum TaxID=1517 RepID=UPI003DA8DCF2
MGISVQDMISFAACHATYTKIPFAFSFAMFAIGRGFEQIRNSVAYSKLNVEIAATYTSITIEQDSATHQVIENISLMRRILNIVVVNPANTVVTKKPFYL